jgi:hypothetical protein
VRSTTLRTSVVAKRSMVEDANDVVQWRQIFASFLSDASSALVEPYFYLLQLNGWKSLCLLTGLSVFEYSKLLLECKLIRVRRNRDGSTTILVEKDQWNYFLVNNNLRGDAYGRGGSAELTDGKINMAAMKRLTGGGGDIKQNHFKKMFLLRVGKICPGTSPPSNTAINNGSEPPRMNHDMRRAKKKLIQAVSQLCLVDIDDPIAIAAAVDYCNGCG